MVEFVVRLIIVYLVLFVVCKLKFVGFGMLGEVYGIVDVFLNDFYVGFVWIEVGDGSKYWFFIFVDIVGGIYWYIKFVIWLKGDIFLIMVSFGWIIIVDYFGFIGVF